MTGTEIHLGQQFLNFLESLQSDLPSLPEDIEYLNPYHSDDVMEWSAQFYRKYFSNQGMRTLVLGINPGRFGGGQTGIAFTDPVVLEEYCGITNTLPKRKELSSTYIYEFIRMFGGPQRFYEKFFISSVCPLGFIRDGRNLNYYDDKKLLLNVDQFIIRSFEAHSSMPFNSENVIVIGKENTKHFERLNKMAGRFQNILTLEHPRFILQYRRKQKDAYMKKWLDVVNSV